MDLLVPRPPSNGSKDAAAVPSASSFARGNSESFFFVLTAEEAAFRVAKDLVIPRGRREQGESLYSATKRATMHPGKRVAEDAVVAELRGVWRVMTEFESRFPTRPPALAQNVVDQDNETATTRSLPLRITTSRAEN